MLSPLAFPSPIYNQIIQSLLIDGIDIVTGWLPDRLLLFLFALDFCQIVQKNAFEFFLFEIV